MLEILFWVFVTAAAIQLFFYLLTLSVFSFYRKPRSTSVNIPGISVIISAKNEAENLKKLIPLLLKQQYKAFEIIVLDDKSTDDTYDYTIELEHKEENFKLVRIDSTPDHINNKKYALTLGIKAAKFDYLVFTDADCQPAGEYWLEEFSHGFTSDKIKFVLGYSQYFRKKGLLSMFINYETILTALHYVGIGLLGNPYMGVGRNIAYRKSFFLKNNGFGKYQGVVGGDDDLLVNQYANRKNTKFILSPNSTVYSIPKTKMNDYILQKTRHLSVGKHYRGTDKLLLGLLSFSKIIFWLSFITAIMSGYQTYFVAGGFFLVMVSLLTVLLVLKKKTGDKSSIWMLPFLDFIFIFYYITTGLKVLFTKKVRWK